MAFEFLWIFLGPYYWNEISVLQGLTYMLAHMGAGIPVGTPAVTKKLLFVSRLVSRRRFLGKGKPERCETQSALNFVRSKSILPAYNLKGESEDRSLQEITYVECNYEYFPECLKQSKSTTKFR